MRTLTARQLQEMMPLARLLDVELVRADAEAVEAEMIVRQDMCTAGGVAHGGALMALADTAGAVGAWLGLPQDAQGTTTIESKTNFVGAARAGETVTARSEPVHRGRRSEVWQTRVTGPDGRLVAVTMQTQMVL
jgi:1,4-dihydroxy-2-naphthoyl-CoA hydrolase